MFARVKDRAAYEGSERERVKRTENHREKIDKKGNESIRESMRSRREGEGERKRERDE